MLDVTELESYGLKSSENVTPVVGSAMSGLPPDVEDVVVWLQPTARSSAAIPTRLVNALRFIAYVTSVTRGRFVGRALLTGNPHRDTTLSPRLRRTARTETPD